MEKIAVLTSGGDAPGMNAAIHAVVNKCHDLGIKVFGINRGYQGLINNIMHLLNPDNVQGICRKGGTILQSARSKEFRTTEGRRKAISVLESRGIEGLIVVGGNGSLQGAKALSEMTKKIKVMGIPSSIDNDIDGCDLSIGFSTACDIVTKALDNIKDTALSFHTDEPRIFAVETMGRKSGWISVLTGMAGEADLVVVPDNKVSFDEVVEKVEKVIEEKNDCIILFSEGITKSEDFVDSLEKELGYRVRYNLLGFQQRGGVPTTSDRILALRMGVTAVESLIKGESARMVTIKEDVVKTKILDIDENEDDNYNYYLNMFEDRVIGF